MYPVVQKPHTTANGGNDWCYTVVITMVKLTDKALELTLLVVIDGNTQ